MRDLTNVIFFGCSLMLQLSLESDDMVRTNLKRPGISEVGPKKP